MPRALLRPLMFLLALVALAGVGRSFSPAIPPINAPKPVHVVIAVAEDEYHAKETLPAFAKSELESKLHYKVTILQSDSKTDLPGLEKLKDADLLIMFLRRRTLTENQLKQFQAYFDSGRPVVALRTSCHAFQNWLEFDKIVLGCHYNNHYAAKGTIKISAVPAAKDNPILSDVAPPDFVSDSSLYKVLPLADTCTPLLTGTWEDKPPEPVAWTNQYHGGRIFFTSLGSPDDFKLPQFRKLLTNGIEWALHTGGPQAK